MAPYKRQSARPESFFTVKWAVSWILITVLSFTCLMVTLGTPYILGHKIKAGDIAEQDYIAEHKAMVVDETKTRQAQDNARQSLIPVFKRDGAATCKVLDRLKAKLDLLQRLTNETALEQAKQKSASRKGKKQRNTPDAAATALNGSRSIPETQELSAASAPDKLLAELSHIIPQGEFSTWRRDIETSTARYITTVRLYPGSDSREWLMSLVEFLPDKYSAPLKLKSARLVVSVLGTNVAIDEPATREQVKRAIEGTSPVMKEIDVGTIIVSQGEEITPEGLAALKAVGITRTQNLHNLLGVAMSLMAAFGLFGLFLYTYEPQYFFAPSAIALMATVCLVVGATASFVGQDYPQFIPLPAAALVLSVIFGRRVSIVLTLLSITFLKVTGLLDGVHLVALGTASGMALGTHIKRRKDLMIAGFLVGILQAVGYFAAAVVVHLPSTAFSLTRELILQMLGGLSSCIVAIGSLPFLEIIFGILTPFRVAELTEPDQPLLRQLEEEAPGTYQHSLAVANLAEAGARAVRADVNLVRAGAMYHDIGKMATPKYFIENQLGETNPHDSMQPEDSRTRVLDHVTKGLELARKWGLPKAVQDFIPEHQGTTIMAYFYHKACMRDGADKVQERDYRYPGPKPQCKETAIVMLADVSEAVTHSLKDPTQEEVDTAIASVFKARWDDGQFTECGLSAEEFERIKKAFVHVWRTLHHDRLKYPSTTTGKMPVPPPMSTPVTPPFER